MVPTSPTVWRRWLAFELRRRREERGLAQREVGKACGWSGARLSYIENGQQNVTLDDLDQLLPLYGVPEDERPQFREAAERSREKGFWERYDSRVVPDWLAQYIGLEQGAASISCVDPVVIPALLQIPEYAAAVIGADVTPRPERQVDELVKLRMERQAVVTRDDEPAALSAIIDESVLWRTAGGPDVMVRQLEHLVEVAERPNVTIRVVPLDGGIRACMFGTYRLLTFAWPSDPGAVYVEHRDGAMHIEDPVAVDNHRLLLEHSESSSLSPDESRELIQRITEEYRLRA
ncbi:MAG TPA: helix-turn-helix transcriptional regulator [Acidimicrobiales bacterium]